jgi:hypothetical protein
MVAERQHASQENAEIAEQAHDMSFMEILRVLCVLL